MPLPPDVTLVPHTDLDQQQVDRDAVQAFTDTLPFIVLVVRRGQVVRVTDWDSVSAAQYQQLTVKQIQVMANESNQTITIHWIVGPPGNDYDLFYS